MKPAVYIESSVISYFANEISADLKVAAEQRITREWWFHILPKVNPLISDLVLKEISRGKPEKAQIRLLVAKEFAVLPMVEGVEELANTYVEKLALPKDGKADAYHLALAAVHDIDFMLSWNCKHIANAFKFALIRKINTSLGYKNSLVICTPRELMEF